MRIRRSGSISKMRLKRPACRWQCQCFNTRNSSSRVGFMRVRRKNPYTRSVCFGLLIALSIGAQPVKLAAQADWDKMIDHAKKEGRVVVSVTTSNDLRAAIEKHFEQKSGIDVQPEVARSAVQSRTTNEYEESG